MNTKSSRRKKERGYSLEHSLCLRINDNHGWHAWRLGGPQQHLPDVFAVNNVMGVAYAIECKSTICDSYVTVYQPQVEYTREFIKHLGRYPVRNVVIAGYFHAYKKTRLLRILPDTHNDDVSMNHTGMMWLTGHKDHIIRSEAPMLDTSRRKKKNV